MRIRVLPSDAVMDREMFEAENNKGSPAVHDSVLCLVQHTCTVSDSQTKVRHLLLVVKLLQFVCCTK